MAKRLSPLTSLERSSRRKLLINQPRVYIAPDSTDPTFVEAVLQGGGEVVPLPTDAEVLLWTDGADPGGLCALLKLHPHFRWVQLPWSGVDAFAEAGLFKLGPLWTSAKGACSLQVAEHAFALALAGLHRLKQYACSGGWGAEPAQSLGGSRVTIFGGGAIAQQLVQLLDPWGCHITLVRRRAEPVVGADCVLDFAHRYHALPEADIIFLSLALTPQTKGLIGIRELDMMKQSAWLVNVARGQHIVTDDLVKALCGGNIGGAALDVTDPEPLPEGHPLRSLPNCLLTPHVATTEVLSRPLIMHRIAENIQRFAAGRDLLGRVEPSLGY